MERTRGMTLSDEQKEEFHREELRKRAKGLRIRLMENHSEVAEVLAFLESGEGQDREALRSLLWQEMVESLPGDKSALEYIAILEQFPQSKGKAKAQLLGQIRSFVKTTAKARAVDRKKILVRERKKLEAGGISGTAVVPRLPEDTDLDAKFAEAMEQFKRGLTAASQE